MQLACKSARELCETLLEESGNAILTGAFDAFAETVWVPFDIETYKGRSRLNTMEDMRALFDHLYAHQKKLRITDMVRNCVEAEFKDSGTLYATYETRLLCGAALVQAPYPVFCIYKFNGARWQASSMTFAIDDSDEHNELLLSAGERLTA